ncbi:HD domain-containing phosphohydrolase [Treponema sp. HNW]|uniref:HD-GYP domain-containing protein n=1 Tax=Treponema sp. HNW TaxID=3116654 RepID=UPI003D0A7F34
MQKIKREALKEGMRFSAPVFFDDGVNMFLAEKKPLTKFHLNILDRWNVLFVITYGKELTGPLSDASDEASAEDLEELEELEEVEEAAAPSFSILTSVRKHLTASRLWQYYTTVMKNIENIYESYRDEDAIDKELLDQSAALVYQLVKEDKNFALNCVFCKLETAAYYPASTINTAVLGAVLAMDLSFPERTVIHLITAGLVRDLEVFKIPAASFSSGAEGMKAADLELLKVHPLRIAKFVSDVLGYPREVAVIIMQYHEHWDGTGYPEGRKGENIDPSARILNVCEAFYTMISEKPHGKEMICYDAVKALLDAKEKLFGPNALKAFIH